MPARRETPAKPSRSRRAPATTPEARENQLIALASDLAERQMQEGTASAQVITHYLKLGSSREKLEQERMRDEIALMKAKKENLETLGRIEGLFEDAIEAMTAYKGEKRQPIESEEY